MIDKIFDTSQFNLKFTSIIYKISWTETFLFNLSQTSVNLKLFYFLFQSHFNIELFTNSILIQFEYFFITSLFNSSSIFILATSFTKNKPWVISQHLKANKESTAIDPNNQAPWTVHKWSRKNPK
jgi:hypothetical protein